ncbi:MAG: elongation factor G [Halanaerobiaceae bacterium]
MATKTEDIRNFALISHGGAGKTTFTEAILANTGQIAERGSVEDGSTKSDFIPEEKDHQYSINSSYFTIPWQGMEFHLIDTPGYADFRGEVAASLRMVEGTVLLIDGTAGIQVNTGFVWDTARKNDLSCFIFVNKMDQEDADFDKIYSELQEGLEGSFMPLSIPYKEDGEYKGVIDLISGKFLSIEGSVEEEENIPDGAQELAEEYRIQFIEDLVELDDELMMKYLEGEEISDKELAGALAVGVAGGNIVPVMAGSALMNSGIDLFLSNIVELLPSPADRNSVEAVSEGEEIQFDTSEGNELLGLVAKTMVDPYIGKLSIFRVYSGEVNKGDEIYVPRIKSKLRISKLYKVNGDEQEEVEKLISGEVGAVAKMDELETSDTISSPDLTNVEMKKIDFPQPMLKLAAFPEEGADEEKMSAAIQRYSLEDPTFQVDYNKVTKELVISGMGSVHISVIRDMCERKFDVGFETREPSVEYKETIRKKVDVEEKYKKQSGGRGQYGHVMIVFEPLPRGKGFEFEEEIFGGAIPSQYIPAVEKGIVEASASGVLAGYPVVDFKATVYDGSYHDVDSSEMAFKIAASKAFKKAVKDARPVILEPIMEVTVEVPEEFMGDIMGDLNSRRGKILGMDPVDGKQLINAEVPQGEMFSYATDLKSITGGYGSFSMEFSHFDKVPSDLEKNIVEEAEREED